MAVRIQLRRDTAANWVSTNPTLRAGEVGIETDTLKFKIGNGTQTWTQITSYANVTPTSLNSSLGNYILAADQGSAGGPAELNSSGDLIIPEDQIILWNADGYDYTTTLTAEEPTANREIIIPNVSGTIATEGYVDNAIAEFDALPTQTGNDGKFLQTTGSTTQWATVDLSTKQDKITGVSDTEIGYLDGVTSAIQTQLNNKSPISSPTFTGTPAAPTAVAGTNTTQIATTAFVKKAVDDLIDGAPGALDTLNELAAALNDDASYASTISTALGNKQDKVSGVSDTEISYLDGVTSAIQNQLNNKVNSADVAELAQDAVGNSVGTGLTYTDSTGEIKVTPNTYDAYGAASAVAGDLSTHISDTSTHGVSGDIVGTTNTQTLSNKTLSSPTITVGAATISSTEIGYLDGVTSEIQTQLDDKLSKTGGTMTGALTLSGAPESALHAATKAYVDNISAGLNFHSPAHAATTTNLSVNYNNGTNGVGATLTADTSRSWNTLDGHSSFSVGDRILVKNQTDAKQNGLYTITQITAPWILTRATDADNNPAGEVSNGDFVFVQNGTQAGFGFIVNTTGTITIGSTNINYVQFNAGQTVVAGTGLQEVTAGNLSIDTSVTADLSTAQTLTNKTISGSSNTLSNIANSSLTNSAITINGTSVSLGGTRTLGTDDISEGSTNKYFSNELAQDAIGNSLGSGLSYNDSTGAISIDTTTIQTRVSGVSDTEIGYLDGVTSSIQTQLDAKLASATASSTYLPLTGGTISSDLTVTGNLTVNGTTTNINTTNLVIEDKNIVLGDVATPSNITANGGGITLNGDTNKTFNWINSTSSWTSSENLDLASGKVLKIAGTQVLSASEYTGNAATVTNGVYTSGSYSDPTWLTISKSKVGLGNVENTTLSTWAGSTNITTLGTIATGTWSGTTIGTTKGGTGLTGYASGDILYASATDTLSKLAKGTDGQILTLASGVPSWAAAPITLPTQTNNSGKYLTTDGSTASWATLLVPITTGTATITANTATTIDSNALSGFTSTEYMVSLKQGSKIRTSKVIVQTDGTSVDMTEFAITETGGTMSGVVVSATASAGNALLQVTVTDATSTNVTVKFSEVKL
jgi:hypothetical protein